MYIFRLSFIVEAEVVQNGLTESEYKDEIKKKVKRVLSIVDLEGFENRKISTLSGGQQQRIAIARALANKPSILFADEPTGNLDGKSGREVLSLLKYCAKEFGITLILVTHDLNVAEQADRILTIEDGAIVNDTKAVQNK